MTKSVYLSGPMQGLTVAVARDTWRRRATSLLSARGIELIDPLRDVGRDFADHEVLGSGGRTTASFMTDRFAYSRDQRDVERCDGLLAVFENTRRVSIGTCFEIAWAAQLHKPLVVVRINDEYHEHLFINESGAAIVDNLDHGCSLMLSMLNA